ncbi:virulence factor BrkB family protein [Aliivibrio kagoshimensis]|uniref:virulence factor BrkB family protein n=1 Tax=Aliivibrio kagoshimensis TaxID=2910230 RepID=UPI003D1181BF
MDKIFSTHNAHRLTVLLNYFRYLWQRIGHDRLPVSAGYMAYITLLSLVPLLTVLLSVLSHFPIFSGVGEVIQQFVISNFVPAAGEAVEQSLNEFISNTGKMTAVGSLFLFVAAVMLISSIDKSLNFIWRVKQSRRRIYSFSMYWMVLTLGPLFVGASIAASSYLASLSILEGELASGFYHQLLGWLPIILSFCAFGVLYLLVPNKKVHLLHALIGALVASVLFELSKDGFALYITRFPSYQLIYGALAAIPILFVWVYLCWLIVLLGAEITASLGEHDKWRYLPTQSFDTHSIESKDSDSIDTTSK